MDFVKFATIMLLFVSAVAGHCWLAGLPDRFAADDSTASSPTNAVPLTHRAKILMMVEGTISLATTVIVLSRAINVIPS